MPRAAIMMWESWLQTIYPASEKAAFEALFGAPISYVEPACAVADPELLSDVELLLGGWGMPALDERILNAMPHLRAVFYCGGSIRGMVTPAFWTRQIPICSAVTANAIPVSEFTLGAILMSLKRVWHYGALLRRSGQYPARQPMPGAYRSTVAVISMGHIGRRVRELLRPFDVNVIAYDPFLTADEAEKLGVEPVTLNEAFERADVVSLHTPEIPETRDLIQREQLTRMRENATLINTARGAIIREHDLLDVLQQRPDLYAVLDVTSIEPPHPDSPLLVLPNVVLTPHIAGSVGNECRRMTQCMLDDAARFLRGEPLQFRITRESAANRA